MPTSPFGLPGAWYRGNLHGHTIESDGTFTPAQYAAYYRGIGHHFTAVTDHRRITDMSAYNTTDFACIPGIELDGPGPGSGGCDVVGLGLVGVPPREEISSLQGRIDAIRARGGLAFVPHPYETGITSRELLDATGYLGIEVWNTCSVVGWGKGVATVQWDEVLQAGRWMAGLATDDAHHRLDQGDDIGIGWVVVRSQALTAPAIMAALADGRFYSSTGPEIHDVRVEADPDSDGLVATVRCSPCRRISFLCNRGLGRAVNAPGGVDLTEARRRLHREAGYLRVECIDAGGRSAWSNPIPLGGPPRISV